MPAPKSGFRFMVIDPGPMTTPARCIRKVDMAHLPEFVTVGGQRFKRTALRPRFHLSKQDALRDAAKRVVRDVGAPGGIDRVELRMMSPGERKDIRDMQAETRERYAHLLR